MFEKLQSSYSSSTLLKLISESPSESKAWILVEGTSFLGEALITPLIKLTLELKGGITEGLRGTRCLLIKLIEDVINLTQDSSKIAALKSAFS